MWCCGEGQSYVEMLAVMFAEWGGIIPLFLTEIAAHSAPFSYIKFLKCFLVHLSLCTNG
jgi:hypothetical protein